MRRRDKIFFVLYVFLILEGLGWLLLYFYSTKNDYIGDKNYDKIRNMLLSKPSQEEWTKYISVPYLNYIPNPNYRKDNISQHSPSGFRGEDVSLTKGKKYRVLCIGGSTTYGTGVENYEDTYPAQLKVLLEKSGKFPLGVEVINAGVEDANSAEELSYYNFKLRYYQPDMVIVHSGGNDAEIFESDENYQFDYTQFRKRAFHLEPARNPIRFFLHSRFLSFCFIHWIYYPILNPSGREVYKSTGSPSLNIAHWTDKELYNKTDESGFLYYPFYQNHKLLLETILKDGAAVLDMNFAYNPDYYEKNNMLEFKNKVDYNNKIIQKICEELGVVMIPYQYESISDSIYWLDDCHLTKKGEFEKAKMVSSYILKTIDN